MSTFEFDDRIGGRLRGTLHVPGATPGYVVTVGANGALSPAPGGGSQPGVVICKRFPITAADVAAAWSGGGASIDLFTPDDDSIILGFAAVIGDNDPFDGDTPAVTLTAGGSGLVNGPAIPLDSQGTNGGYASPVNSGYSYDTGTIGWQVGVVGSLPVWAIAPTMPLQAAFSTNDGNPPSTGSMTALVILATPTT